MTTLCHHYATLWPESERPTAAAVCMAESGGRADAQNCSTGRECSLGLWQINVWAHPQYDPDRLLSDPDYNARAAREIWDRQGWQAWGAYTAGTYRRYLDDGALVSAEPPVERSSALGLAVLVVAALLLLEAL